MKLLNYNSIIHVILVIFIALVSSLSINIFYSSNAFEHNLKNNKIGFSINGAEVISGYPLEGNLIVAKTNPNYQIELENEPLEMSKDGIFVIGFHRDSNKNFLLNIKTDNGGEMSTKLVAKKRTYNIQRINGLKQSMVSPPKEVLERINSDSLIVKEARKKNNPLGDFWQGFDWPVIGHISSVFGSQRILNNKPRSPHYGVDIAAPKGTLISAPSSGTITLAKDLYFSGLTVILNHGLGVNSSFLHLDEIRVNEGDQIERGEIIGTLGDSGRSTGPHLDWRIDWKGRRLDAALLAGPMPKFPEKIILSE